MAGSGFKANVEFEGLEEPLAGLRRLHDLGTDLTPFMEDARGILVASILNRFRTSTGPEGIPWKPSRRALGKVPGKPAGRTLVDTADLQGSIRGEVTRTSVEVGSDGLKSPVKALANQFGSHTPTVVRSHFRTVTSVFGAKLDRPEQQFVSAHTRITNLPARPFVGIDGADVADIDGAWQRRIIATFAKGPPA